MNRSLVAGLVLAASPIAVIAQNSGTPAGQEATAKGRVDTDTQEAITFADPGNATAKAFAEAIGISVGEATSRLRAQARLARVVADLSAKYPDEFAGLKLEQKGAFRIRALFKGNADRKTELAEMGERNGVGKPIEQSPAVMSLREARAFGDRLVTRARASGKRAVFSVDEKTGDVVIGGAEDPALREAAQQAAQGIAIKVRFDPSLQIVETNNAIAGEEFNGDGTTTESNGCTTGFAVQNVTYGITTAGHCQNAPAEFNIYTNTTYGSGDKLTFKAEYKNGTDVQWHNLAETNDQTAPYYWNGTQSIAIASSYKTAIPAGYGMCKFGRETKWDCGTTGATVRDSNYGNGLFYSVSGTVDMSMEGESGGLVVNGQTAYGWIHGRGTTHPYVMYYTAIQDVYALTPLRIIVCVQPC